MATTPDRASTSEFEWETEEPFDDFAYPVTPPHAFGSVRIVGYRDATAPVGHRRILTNLAGGGTAARVARDLLWVGGAFGVMDNLAIHDADAFDESDRHIGLSGSQVFGSLGSAQWDEIVGRDHAPPVATLSATFFRRLLSFVSWSPGWDGQEAEHVEVATAARALQFAQKVASPQEPFVAPAPDGSLLLQWDGPDGSVVDVYIGETEPGSAFVTRGTEVDEVPIQAASDIRELLVM